MSRDRDRHSHGAGQQFESVSAYQNASLKRRFVARRSGVSFWRSGTGSDPVLFNQGEVVVSSAAARASAYQCISLTPLTLRRRSGVLVLGHICPTAATASESD